jgi:hypothetical protein
VEDGAGGGDHGDHQPGYGCGLGAGKAAGGRGVCWRNGFQSFGVKFHDLRHLKHPFPES